MFSLLLFDNKFNVENVVPPKCMKNTDLHCVFKLKCLCAHIKIASRAVTDKCLKAGLYFTF